MHVRDARIRVPVRPFVKRSSRMLEASGRVAVPKAWYSPPRCLSRSLTKSRGRRLRERREANGSEHGAAASGVHGGRRLYQLHQEVPEPVQGGQAGGRMDGSRMARGLARSRKASAATCSADATDWFASPVIISGSGDCGHNWYNTVLVLKLLH